MKQLTQDAYAREMQLIPVVIDMERQGVRIDPSIIDIQEKWHARFMAAEKILCKAVQAEPGTKAWFVKARQKGLIDEDLIEYTEKGNPRYGREHVERIVKDEEIKQALILRSKLQKALGTYIKPYAASALKYNGRFYPYFSQVRDVDNYGGTTTGRFSSNFQQLPRNPPDDDSLPNLRALVFPEEGHVVIKRDFNGQELRVTAHYAEGNILYAYQQNPLLDVHTWVKEMILGTTGRDLNRVVVKTIAFLKLYGGGPAKLASMLDMSENEARVFFAAYDKALPEFKQLMKEVESTARSGHKIRTWGGRRYSVEKPVHGREFYYKLGNVLIQGSSADMTKEGMIRYYNSPDRQGRIMLVVHDEIVCSIPEDKVESEMALLRWAMDEIPGWDVPLRSEGKIGPNFGHMEKYVDN